jgi:FkbH-like protein
LSERPADTSIADEIAAVPLDAPGVERGEVPPSTDHRGTREAAGLTWLDRRRVARELRRRRAALIDTWAATQLDPDRLARYRVEGVGDGESERASLVEGFVAPLVDLLTGYVRTGASRYRDVYLDERLRYAPFRAAPATRLAFFREVLAPDEAAVLRALPVSSSLRRGVRRLLTELHEPLLVAPDGPIVRVLGLGDCLLNELRVFLPARCRRAGIGVDLRSLYFSAVENRALDVSEVLRFLEHDPMDLIAVSFLTYAGIPAYRALLNEAERLTPREAEDRVTGIAQLMRGWVEALRAHTDIPLLIHGASGLPLSRWRRHLPMLPPLSSARRHVLDLLNSEIRELVQHTHNAILIDEAAVARAHGHRSCEQPVVPRRLARRAFFHTARLGEYLSEPYADIIRSYQRLHKAKVLLVDFDGTLWDGVMADGPVGHHRERQELLRRLKDAGVLLVAVSKNDPTSIRWNEMALQPSDFVLQKISWRLKVEAIQEAAQELDLGLDTFVLVDDSPVERDLAQSQLPAVVTLDSLDPFTWRSLERMLQFPNTRETEEARTRTQMYQQSAARRAALAQTFDYPTMMAGLELKAGFGVARGSDLDRVAELIQRTNQFNTTTIRYSRQDLAALLESEAHGVYVATLSDKFGALGLVAVAIIERRESDAVFNALVMSCRAMGFQLERLVVRSVLEAERNAQRFIGRFVPTDRNTPAMSLFRDCGFRDVGSHEWLLDQGMPWPEPPAWLTVAAR